VLLAAFVAQLLFVVSIFYRTAACKGARGGDPLRNSRTAMGVRAAERLVRRRPGVLLGDG